ncbi:unnamed protein product [Rotaria socialis]|uniref:Uncharacterized protein n=1 Tax=Rotaria socialis TaxID=392032 RepID=A0A821XZW7_9BILA|nr:unnamed protein product [Rotaria socialis]CAF3324409.1 unnamed protein product [Rotaria socialis]CAF3369143.1 unnamed protein product [Rotaria socialis]CAF3371836.1 unnamed protein product [Rotaria socialis]CAF3641835.1 unnamed protein product [Rotaria socialis]
MNVTDDMPCNICLTSYGSASVDHRATILMVVLVAIVLVACHVSVLWCAIRTRYEPDKTVNVIDTTVHDNEAYNIEEEYDEDIVHETETARISILRTATIQHVHSISEKSSM